MFVEQGSAFIYVNGSFIMQKSLNARNPTVVGSVLLGLAFMAKWLCGDLSAEQLSFLLRPVATVVRVFTGEAYQVVANEGYFFEAFKMIIDRSCSGLNFMIIAAATFIYLLLSRTALQPKTPLMVITVLLAAYVLTLVINSMRILTMVQIQEIGFHIGAAMHEALGVFFFLTALVLASIGIQRTLIRHNAQLS